MATPNLLTQHTRQEILTAATALGKALIQCEKYAIVGGAACVLLGSTRTTQDIDFVVPRGATLSARQLLRSSAGFVVESKTNHTWYNTLSPNQFQVQIDILAPPSMFQEEFGIQTEVVTIGANIKVLKPALLLSAKCGSITSRSAEVKRATDSQDICFLLKYCAENPVYLPRASEVPRATKEFVQWFIGRYGGQSLWVGAGYDQQIGCFIRE